MGSDHKPRLTAQASASASTNWGGEEPPCCPGCVRSGCRHAETTLLNPGGLTGAGKPAYKRGNSTGFGWPIATGSGVADGTRQLRATPKHWTVNAMMLLPAFSPVSALGHLASGCLADSSAGCSRFFSRFGRVVLGVTYHQYLMLRLLPRAPIGVQWPPSPRVSACLTSAGLGDCVGG